MAKEDRITISFDRLNKKFSGIDNKVLTELETSFPNINIVQELKKMALWLQTAKGSHRRGNLRFILSWLSRSEPDIPTVFVPIDPKAPESSLPPLIRSYLEELWEGRESLFRFNHIQSQTH